MMSCRVRWILAFTSLCLVAVIAVAAWVENTTATQLPVWARFVTITTIMLGVLIMVSMHLCTLIYFCTVVMIAPGYVMPCMRVEEHKQLSNIIEPVRQESIVINDM
jgi:hypothetical protein